MDIIRVLRIVEYEGPRDVVEEQVASSLHGTKTFIRSKGRAISITAVTVGEFPTVLREIEAEKSLEPESK